MTTPPIHRVRNDLGFTLIEIIITLVILAIMASLLVTTLGTSFLNSPQPLTGLQQTVALQAVMESIRADFLMPSSPRYNNIDALRTNIGTAGNSYTNGYGSYEVIENTTILFSGYAQVEGAGDYTDYILKVQLKDSTTGMILTDLFVQL